METPWVPVDIYLHVLSIPKCLSLYIFVFSTSSHSLIRSLRSQWFVICHVCLRVRLILTTKRPTRPYRVGSCSGFLELVEHSFSLWDDIVPNRRVSMCAGMSPTALSLRRDFERRYNMRLITTSRQSQMHIGASGRCCLWSVLQLSDIIVWIGRRIFYYCTQRFSDIECFDEIKFGRG